MDTSSSSGLLKLDNFIDGEFVPSLDYIPSIEPAIGKVWALVANSDVHHVHKAVDAAKRAFTQWSSKSWQERCSFLIKAATLLESRLDSFAIAEARDQGKPLHVAKSVDIPRAVRNLRHFANTFPNILNTSSTYPEDAIVNYTARRAVGVAALISPWNLPLYLLTFKLAPALAAGNTVVCKPSELTSVTAWMFCSLLREAGFPAGVVNMVFGVGAKAGEALVLHPDVRLISFTGGVETGKRVYTNAAAHLKKLSLELGGKNAGIIFEDVDLSKCVAQTIRSTFFNQGEICLATSRLFVQRSIFPKFVEEFVEKTKALSVGPSLSESTNIGPLISKEHKEKVLLYLRAAKADGALIHCGENNLTQTFKLDPEWKNGYYFSPTVVTNLTDDSICMREEIFGPFVCITPFDTVEEVIGRVNSVPYGLCATVWTQDGSLQHRLAHAIDVGTVWVNCWLERDLNMPFGGTKLSGLGREGTHHSLEFFTEEKTICIHY